jgi:nucleoid-associated protein YgaU
VPSISSRYISVGKINYVVASGESVGILKMRPTTTVSGEETMSYIVKAGDTFESLAAKYLGNGRKWWILADMNSHIFWPLSLSPGDRIVIPSRVQALLS